MLCSSVGRVIKKSDGIDIPQLHSAAGPCLCQIIVTSEEDYAKLTADEIYSFWHEKIAVDAQDFDRIVDACMK